MLFLQLQEVLEPVVILRGCAVDLASNFQREIKVSGRASSVGVDHGEQPRGPKHGFGNPLSHFSFYVSALAGFYPVSRMIETEVKVLRVTQRESLAILKRWEIRDRHWYLVIRIASWWTLIIALMLLRVGDR
jgi:hypothetical protein